MYPEKVKKHKVVKLKEKDDDGTIKDERYDVENLYIKDVPRTNLNSCGGKIEGKRYDDGTIKDVRRYDVGSLIYKMLTQKKF